MNCKVEEINTFGRKLHIDISATDFNEQINRKIRKLSTTAKIKGFRPGKAPTDVIERYYGAEIEKEAANTLIYQSYEEVLKQHDFRSLISPSFEDMEINRNQGIRFTVYIEIIPDLQLNLDGITIEKPTCDISEADVNAMVEQVRKNHAQWQPKTDAARTGDRLTVDIGFPKYDSEIAKPLTGQQIVLGSGFFDGDVDRQLENIRVGEKREVTTNSPGKDKKTQHYSIHVKAIEEPILPELNDDFFKACNIKEGGLAALHRALREGMEWELKKKLKHRFHENIKDAILKHNEIESPPSLLRDRIASLKEKMSQDRRDKNADGQGIEDEIIKDIASRQVRLNIIFLHLAKKYEVRADRRSCDVKITELAADYAQPEKIMDYYRSHADAYQTVEALVIEDKTIDFLIEKVDTTEKQYSFTEIIDSKATAD